MANEMQRGNLTGTAIMRMPISGTVSIGGKQMKELRFMPYSEFPEEGREDVLYIDTDGNAMYYWDGTEYIALSGGGSGGTSNYNELSNKPSINDITLTGDKTSADLGLQPTISDLATIRSGAASGATAVQPSDMETALVDKQDVISDLDAIRSGATAGNTALQPEDVDTLPTDGSSNPVSSGGTYNFVNSSIATNTAYFIGTFASVADLEAYTGTVTNNDYAFVTSTDSAGNTLYNRYKYNAETQTWSFEYAVNNTAFTAAQWAAIQSGMTASDKTKLDGIEQGANKTVIDAAPTSGSSNAVSSGSVNTALSGKQDTISDLSDIRSGASAGATAVQPSALNGYQTKLSGTNKLDPSYIEYDATHRAVTDTEKSTWNGKQDTISDLSTIRSGAAAGATAVQPTDMNTALAAKQDTLTFDSAPTESSTNPVTSGGIWADQQRQDALEAEDRAALIAKVDGGAKNIANFTFGGVVQNENVKPGTIVCTENDGVFDFSGTSDNKNYAAYILKQIKVNAGKYIISGVSGGSKTTYWMRFGSGTTDAFLFNIYDGAREVNFTSDMLLTVQFVIYNNQTVSNIIVAPMICTAADYAISQAFVPYRPSWQEMWEMIQALQSGS